MNVCISKAECYWPQITDFKQIYEENKECIFILNKREPLKLLNSFKNWFKYDERLCQYNPELINKFNGSNDEKLTKLFMKHYNDVEIFFKSRAESKFISYDIENDSIEKLSKYINLKGEKVFPHKNKNEK